MEDRGVEERFQNITKKKHNTPTKYNSSEFQITKRGGLIGQGTYSSVLQCKHDNLKTVAVKCYHIYGNPKEVDKKLQNAASETVVLTKVSHENIVQLHGYTSWKKNDENYHGIIMELCNESLDQFIQRRKNENPEIPWELRVRFVKEIIDALKYLHHDDSTKSIIHGDLKPENILLTADLIVKLTDFGSCEIEKAAGIETISINIPPNQQHTPYYAAPEFLKDSSKKNCSMDIYSFSMVCYEIITLQKIYSDSPLGQRRIVCAIIYSDQRPDLSKFDKVEKTLTNRNKRVCQTLRKLIQNCWSKQSNFRPTASQVCKNLQNLCEKWKISFQNNYSRFAQPTSIRDFPYDKKISLSEYSSNHFDETEKRSCLQKHAHFRTGQFGDFQNDLKQTRNALRPPSSDWMKQPKEYSQFCHDDKKNPETKFNKKSHSSVNNWPLSTGSNCATEFCADQSQPGIKHQENEPNEQDSFYCKPIAERRQFFMRSQSESRNKLNYDKSKRFSTTRDEELFSNRSNFDISSNANLFESKKVNRKQGSSEQVMEDFPSLDTHVGKTKIYQKHLHSDSESESDGEISIVTVLDRHPTASTIHNEQITESEMQDEQLAHFALQHRQRATSAINDEIPTTSSIDIKQLTTTAMQKNEIVKKNYPHQYSSEEFCTNSDKDNLIGSGSYASVLWCTHEKLEDVAVKCYCLRGEKKRIEDEATHAISETNGISHKNIVQFHGYIMWTQHQKTFYGIVVELCRSSLDEFISVCYCKKQDLPWRLRLKFLNEIADALAYLHHHNPNKPFVHGDLKPTNILLTNDLTVKLGDLESTKIKKRLKMILVSTLSDLNQRHTSIYAAPGFLKDLSEKSCSMDIYSFSIIGYEIITLLKASSTLKGNKNHMGKRYLKPAEKELKNALKRLKDMKDKELCDCLIQLVQACWNGRPSLRPTALKVQSELQTLAKRKREALQNTICLSQYPFRYSEGSQKNF